MQNIWTLSKQELPRDQKDVLCCSKTGIMFVGYYDEDHDLWCASSGDNFYVTVYETPKYWMPMPVFAPLINNEKGDNVYES